MRVVEKNFCLALVSILLGVLFTSFAHGSSAVKELLPPAERLWLMNNQSRIVLAVETSYAPFVFLDSKGSPTGLAHDYMLLLESKLDVHFKQRCFSSLADILEKVPSGEIHIVNAVTETPERSTILTFTEPFVSVPNVIIARKESSSPMGEENLLGLKVSLVKNYAVTEYLAKKGLGFVPDLVPDDLTTLLSVSFGRSDAAIIDLAAATYLISKEGITNLRVAGKTPFDIRLAIGTPMNEPVLHAILQKGLEAITDEEREQIHKRWISMPSSSILSDWRFWGVVGSVLTIVFAVIIGILIWNRTLREKVALRTEALENEKERLAVTLRSIGDGVISTDVYGNIVIMNKIAEKMCGWSLAEAHGKPFTTIFQTINEITRKPCENPVEKVLSSGQIIELENHTVLISRDGSELVTANSGAPIMDTNSTTIGVVLVFRDMTERKKLFDALQRTDKLDSLGVLAGGIAHDFNNMLAGIFGYIDLARDSTTEKTTSEYLDKSIAVFSRAKDLTQQLLTFSKGGTPQRKTAELAPLLRECASFALSGSKVACDYAIDNDLWLSDFDKNQIGQVIDNLVINARQAMPVGGRIVISAKNIVIEKGNNLLLKAGMFIKLSITDTGIGIPADLLKRIFDPFFTTKEKGHGLGLATCYSIVQKHEGCIDVESVMGKGSTFHVFLPASQGTLQDLFQTPVSHKGSGRILIMDDEPSIREILGRFLKEMGYTTLEANDGEEALRIFAETVSKGTPIDGAFFDLTIPGGMGGKETIVQFRKQYPNMPVYASSGYSENPVMARPTEYGFADSICKPYRKDELAAMLNRHASKDVSGGNTP